MSFEAKNPFAGCGTILSTARLIGRQSAKELIEDRVIRDAGSVSICGMACIGKSSLVNAMIMERKEELYKQGLLPIEIDLLQQDGKPENFFRKLVKLCNTTLEELGWHTEHTRRAVRVALQSEAGYGFEDIKAFFDEAHKDGIRFVCVLDKFDYSGVIFKDNMSAFQGLITLAEQPSCKVSFITLSFHAPSEIAPYMQAISNFDKVFHQFPLKEFNDTDMEEYFRRLTSTGFPVDNLLKSKLDFYCGRHPYLLEKLGYELIEEFRRESGKRIDADMMMRTYNMKHVFISYMRGLVESLRQYGETLPGYNMLSKLQQVVVGPVVDINQDVIEMLESYGLIKVNKNTTPNEYKIVPNYVAFCHHLQSLLNTLDLDEHLWPLWSRTEKMMRLVIASILESVFGEDWFAVLEKNYPYISYSTENKGDIYGSKKGTYLFERCKIAHQNALFKQTLRPATNMLDYTYPKELFDLILYPTRPTTPPATSLWDDLFRPIFNKDSWKDRKYWEKCANLLGLIRNPLAHNRSESIYKTDHEKASEYCRDICQILEPYMREIEQKRR